MTEKQLSIHIVIGMPGSGKTTYLQDLLARKVIDCYFDDYQRGAPKLKDDPEDRRVSDPRLSPHYADLKAAISAGSSAAIADIRYCVPEEEALIKEFATSEFPEATLILTYFENNPEACRHNVHLRDRKTYLARELHNIDVMTAIYKPPQNESLAVIMG